MLKIQEFVQENPLLRYQILQMRRTFGRLDNRFVRYAILAILAMGYLYVLWIISQFNTLVIGIPFAQVGILTLAVPLMLYPAIAQEREARTWDFLRIAPVTPAQIVMAKCVRGFLLTIFLVALSLVPLVFGYFAAKIDLPALYGPTQVEDFRLGDLIVSQLIVLTYGCLVTVLSVWLSSLFRRGLASLIAAISVQMIWHVLIPVFSSFNRTSQEMLMGVTPFTILAFWSRAVQANNPNPTMLGQLMGTSLIYLVITLILWFVTTSALFRLDKKESN